MSKRVKAGVVGAGVFGAHHARKFAQSAMADLIGVFDVDTMKAATLADDIGACAFERFDELLAKIDAVTIASPAQTHFEMARWALIAGKHVYVEKPLALTLEDADELLRLADEQGVILQVGHQERFVLDALGLPLPGCAPLEMEFKRCGPATGRGEDVCVVFDLMIHDLDLVRMFGMGKALNVSAAGNENETVATVVFEGGARCSFVASRQSHDRARSMSAVYEHGAVQLDFLSRQMQNSSRHNAVCDFASLSHEALQDPLGFGVTAFLRSILGGLLAMVDGRAGRGALELATLIVEARSETNTTDARSERLCA
ncbi:MAG: Gfo/Idh/MocA family oxidoreductase [Parvularculaceae bacterium]